MVLGNGIDDRLFMMCEGRCTLSGSLPLDILAQKAKSVINPMNCLYRYGYVKDCARYDVLLINFRYDPSTLFFFSVH